MAYVIFRIEVPGATDTQLNKLVEPNSKPHEGLIQLRNLVSGVAGGTVDGEILVSVRATDLSIPANGTGQTATYNLK